MKVTGHGTRSFLHRCQQNVFPPTHPPSKFAETFLYREVYYYMMIPGLWPNMDHSLISVLLAAKLY